MNPISMSAAIDRVGLSPELSTRNVSIEARAVAAALDWNRYSLEVRGPRVFVVKR